MTRHRLALLADVRHRRRLPQVASNGRSQGEENVRRDTALADQSTILAEIEAERQRIRARRADIEKQPDQGVADPVVVELRTGAVDHTGAFDRRGR